MADDRGRYDGYDDHGGISHAWHKKVTVSVDELLVEHCVTGCDDMMLLHAVHGGLHAVHGGLHRLHARCTAGVAWGQ